MAFATVVVLVDALVGEHGLAATLRARRIYDVGQARLARMRAENAALRDAARRLATDPRAIEALARTELGLIRPGEVLFVIKPAKPAIKPAKPAIKPAKPAIKPAKPAIKPARPAGGAPTGLEP